ncbi:carbohydrate binding family 9 domain-containing protein [Colwellia sp. MSW7]|uniref:Carbohydrate binding family 9 domain-containing protein n=1 Tax=Colwellia maritima TaxID=2912588 RepID=A0ABS9X2U1_9GAMM|nr:carbohydrate binding family 9 domain-containing protein [Colwellia maritima]MCI2284564.1 carbohydrate binding family 9 domain-containing protein [Colwellia maritima]
MQKLSFINLLVLFVAFLLISPISAAQAINALPIKENITKQPLNIPFAKGKIIIDGELDDTLWSNALTIDLNIVNNPWNNLASPIDTTAKIIENGKFLYVSFIASDPNPENIQGFLTDRDNAWSHDLVGIKLDTHNNRRLNYEFFVNPYGVQNDATFNEITGQANSAWDGLWFSFGKKTEQGYQVEIAIPYNILNFESDGQVKKWAIELVRTYPRDTNLRISHVPIDRDNPSWLCQYPEAIGFKKATIGKNIRLTPSLTATRYDTRDIYVNSSDVASDWSAENDVEAGWIYAGNKCP